MKALILSAVILGVAAGFVAAQQREPPKEGEFICQQVPTTKDAHRCDCPGMHKDPMCKKVPGVEDEQEPEIPYEESAKCLNACKKEKCFCMRACDT